MKFQYYITDLFIGMVTGTNSIEDAMAYSLSEDHYVVDSINGVTLVDGKPIEIGLAASVNQG